MFKDNSFVNMPTSNKGSWLSQPFLTVHQDPNFLSFCKSLRCTLLPPEDSNPHAPLRKDRDSLDHFDAFSDMSEMQGKHSIYSEP